ncbi:MAG: hypothetical protein Q9162_006520 [Coniocarpon cinnabarinum]
MKRKLQQERTADASTIRQSRKRRRTTRVTEQTRHLSTHPADVNHPVLKNYFGRVLRLRQWLLERSEVHSASRRRQNLIQNASDEQHLLDGVLVGVPADIGLREALPQTSGTSISELEVGILESSHEASQALGTARNRVVATATPTAKGGGGRIAAQQEIVDCAIWLLYHKCYRSNAQPPHLLCRGFQRSTTTNTPNISDRKSTIPGIVQTASNEHVDMLKSPMWASLTSLLGAHGYVIMLELMLLCAIFQPVKHGNSTLYQVSGE